MNARDLIPSTLALLLAILTSLLLLAGCGSAGAGTGADAGDLVLPTPDPEPDPDPDPDPDPGDDGGDDTGGTPGAFALVDTGQTAFYSDTGVISAPTEGQAFAGQDAHYDGYAFRYVDHGDGTVSDLVTGLMWQQDPGAKVTFAQAKANADSFSLAGYDDWRLPTIKELYSLIDFRGVTGTSAATSTPYLDTSVFVFRYGDESAGERFIDSQMATSTEYVSTTMNGSHTMFGVNFADGRIKGYGTSGGPNGEKTFFCYYVRGNADYGKNVFESGGDGTVTDTATGLMWLQADSGSFGAGDRADGTLTWEQALAWAENLTYAGHSDWRLPNAKELQSLVDYTRSPSTHGTAAIDPLFTSTGITNEAGQADYGWYWASTTHLDGPTAGVQGVYVCFGRALGT